MIPLIMDEDLVKLGDNSFLNWEPDKHPHILITGRTGSGKTYFCQGYLGRVSLYAMEAQTYVFDFKGDRDFEFLAGSERFYRFNECADGLRIFYERFEARQRGEDKSRHLLLMFFDEWASFCNSQEKKEREYFMKLLSNLLMLGRSFSVNVCLSQQRADSAFFSTGSRDNFSLIVALGNQSKEAIEMFFSDYRDSIKPDRKRGTGYLLYSGQNLTRVIVPVIRNMDKLHAAIKESVTR